MLFVKWNEMQVFALLLVVSVCPELVCGSEQEEQLFALADRMSASLSAEGNALEESRAKEKLY